MRWIFASLIIINAATLVWGLVGGSDAAVPQPTSPRGNPYSQYPEIVLLSELASAPNTLDPLPSSDTGQAVDVPAPAAGLKDEVLVEAGESEGGGLGAKPVEQIPMKEGRPLCEMVGPFESEGVANDFVQRLQAIEVSSEVKDMELPAGAGYWVYLAPLPTRQEALRTLGELQAKRIDSYVIPKGELANGISLGMFSKKSLSDARVKEMESIGLSPQVDEIERSYRELWVMLASGEGSKMSSLTWQRAMEGINDLERRQNYCLDVASQ